MRGRVKRLLDPIFGRRRLDELPGPQPPEPAQLDHRLDAGTLDGQAPTPILRRASEPAYADQRVAEITNLFESREWQLQLRPVDDGIDGLWEATFFPTELGATTSTVVYALTRLDAAETAWWRYKREPWLRAT
jgi:hypothetical protein